MLRAAESLAADGSAEVPDASVKSHDLIEELWVWLTVGEKVEKCGAWRGTVKEWVSCQAARGRTTQVLECRTCCIVLTRARHADKFSVSFRNRIEKCPGPDWACPDRSSSHCPIDWMDGTWETTRNRPLLGCCSGGFSFQLDWGSLPKY